MLWGMQMSAAYRELGVDLRKGFAAYAVGDLELVVGLEGQGPLLGLRRDGDSTADEGEDEGDLGELHFDGWLEIKK